MRTAVYVPTRGFPYAGVISRLNEDQIPYSFMVGNQGWSITMNRIVAEFLKTDAEICVFLDDDTIPPNGWLPKLVEPVAEGQFDVVGAPVLIAKEGQVFTPNTYNSPGKPYFGRGLEEVEFVGSACLAVSRKTLEEMVHIRDGRPFAEKMNGAVVEMGGDMAFCWECVNYGHKIAVNFDVVCEHYRHVHLNAAHAAYVKALR